MWKINCWLASLSATDTHFNSAVLRQLHVPAYPALRSRHFPLVPSDSGFIVPRAGGKNKRMPELWAGWQRLHNSSQARRGPLAARSEGRSPAPLPALAGDAVSSMPPAAARRAAQVSARSGQGCPMTPQLPPSPPRPSCAPARPPCPPLPVSGAVVGKRSFSPR